MGENDAANRVRVVRQQIEPGEFLLERGELRFAPAVFRQSLPHRLQGRREQDLHAQGAVDIGRLARELSQAQAGQHVFTSLGFAIQREPGAGAQLENEVQPLQRQQLPGVRLQHRGGIVVGCHLEKRQLRPQRHGGHDLLQRFQSIAHGGRSGLPILDGVRIESRNNPLERLVEVREAWLGPERECIAGRLLNRVDGRPVEQLGG